MAEKKDIKWWIEAIRAILAVIAGLLGSQADKVLF